jgi:ATP-dependent protease Clp ATPase subunit
VALPELPSLPYSPSSSSSPTAHRHHHVELDKTNVIIYGPTGSGKTHLVKSLAKVR